MFVSGWMTKKVITVSPEDSIADAARLAREKGIKHLPVVKGDKIIGILSDRDIKDYVPTKATSLDVYELHYLLAKTRVKEVMKRNVLTVSPDTPIEQAAMIMHDKNIGCLPVVESDHLAGIISDRDIFRVLVDITGIRHGGHRVAMFVEDRPGSIKEVADMIRKHQFSLQSILTSYENVRKGSRFIVIRIKGQGNFRALRAELEGAYKNVNVKKG